MNVDQSRIGILQVFSIYCRRAINGGKLFRTHGSFLRPFAVFEMPGTRGQGMKSLACLRGLRPGYAKPGKSDHQEERKWTPESRPPEHATSITTSSASSTTPCMVPRTARHTCSVPRPPVEASSPPSSGKHKRCTRRWLSRRKGIWASVVPTRGRQHREVRRVGPRSEAAYS